MSPVASVSKATWLISPRLGGDGLFLAADGGHDLLIVDRMLPGLDGVGLQQPRPMTVHRTGAALPVWRNRCRPLHDTRNADLKDGSDEQFRQP
jgi:hypothetical protein